jgi:hypothetical protein
MDACYVWFLVKWERNGETERLRTPGESCVKIADPGNPARVLSALCCLVIKSPRDNEGNRRLTLLLALPGLILEG